LKDKARKEETEETCGKIEKKSERSIGQETERDTEINSGSNS